jgi:hypothetical protein
MNRRLSVLEMLRSRLKSGALLLHFDAHLSVALRLINMLVGRQIIAIAGCATATLHHVYVGQTTGAFIHALELDDATRRVYEMGMIPAAGASPSLVLAPGDVCKPVRQSSRLP